LAILDKKALIVLKYGSFYLDRLRMPVNDQGIPSIKAYNVLLEKNHVIAHMQNAVIILLISYHFSNEWID
jgi:hypothetical protein